MHLAASYLGQGDHARAREHVHSVAGRAAPRTDARAAFRHLLHAISFVPQLETVIGDDFDLLASMFEQLGEEDRAQALLEELELIRRTDRR